MPTVGLDLDEKGKPTAIAVVEEELREDERRRKDVYQDIWFLERLSASSENEVMDRMAEIVDITHWNGGKSRTTLYANVTGPGKPGLGVLRFKEVRPPMTPVYLTDGDERVEGDRVVKVGKGWLVYRLQELLSDGRLQPLAEARAGAEELKQQLLDYRIGDEPGPLMIALGLAVQEESGGRMVIRTVGGPRWPSDRERQARRLITDALDRGIFTTQR